MDRALARLYARMGRRYPLAALAFIWLNAVALAALFVEVVVTRHLRLHWSVVIEPLLVVIAGLTVAVCTLGFILIRTSMPLIRWMDGERDADPPEVVWSMGVRLPHRFLLVAGPVAAISVTPGLIGILRIIAAPWHTTIVILGGSSLLVSLALSLDMATLVAFLRPVLKEVDEVYPRRPDTDWAPQSSIMRRIVIAVLLVVITSAWLTSGVTARETNPTTTIGLTVIAGLGIGLTFSLVLTLALSQSLMGPVTDLVSATKRVAAGDLSARVPHVANDELGQLAQSFNEMTSGLAERQALHSALGTYIDPVVADRLLNEGEILEGDEVDATILFVDIVAFTMRAEHLSPREVVTELNEFFQLLIPIVSSHGGHTNKLLGDGFMAVFGAPVPLIDHADRALAAAHEIQRAMEEQYGTRMSAGVGLNSGPVVVGTTGGGTKLDFTVIGDAVNVASRVEALTRETGDEILITASTKEALTSNADLLPRGDTMVKGRVAPVQIFAALSGRPD